MSYSFTFCAYSTGNVKIICMCEQTILECVAFTFDHNSSHISFLALVNGYLVILSGKAFSWSIPEWGCLCGSLVHNAIVQCQLIHWIWPAYMNYWCKMSGKIAFYFHSCISVTKLTNKTNHYWQDYSINWSNLNASTWRCSDVDSNCIRLITLALSMCKIPIWKYILLLRIGGAWNVENSINSISVDKEFLCHKAHFFINCLVCIFIKHVQNFIRN